MNKEQEEILKNLLIEIEELGLKDSAGFRNLLAIKQYTVDTRRLFRQLEKDNKNYLTQIQQMSETINLMREQLQQLQVKVYSVNTTA